MEQPKAEPIKIAYYVNCLTLVKGVVALRKSTKKDTSVFQRRLMDNTKKFASTNKTTSNKQQEQKQKQQKQKKNKKRNGLYF